MSLYTTADDRDWDALRADRTRRDDAPRPSLRARLTARLHAHRFDRMLAVGMCGPADSPLAAHAERLISRPERDAIARSLRRAVHDAHRGRAARSAQVQLHREKIVAAAKLIDDVALLLQSGRPVSARGVARLRQLLSDGRGPLYRYGRGDLEGRMGAALAAM
jgi:hypothetical protein